MTEIRNGLSSEFISHPGETLEELLEQYGISQKELSIKTETSEKHINEIIKGKKDVSVTFAKKLENVFKPNASFWINRQNIYAEKLETLRNIEDISKEEREVVKAFPIKELVNFKYLPEDRNEVEEVLSLRKFCGVSNLLTTPEVLNYMLPSLAFKKDNTKSEYNPYKVYSWLRMCQTETELINNPNVYTTRALRESLDTIKSLSLYRDFNDAYQRLIKTLYKAGINFKIVHNFKGLNVQGFIKPIRDNVSMCLTIKWHSEDVFWFSLFHEFGHLLHKRNTKIFVDLGDEEDEANSFARDYLIEPSTYNNLIKNITRASIVRCAKENNICPAIVVGRLCKDNYITHNAYKDLVRSISWNENA